MVVADRTDANSSKRRRYVIAFQKWEIRLGAIICAKHYLSEWLVMVVRPFRLMLATGFGFVKMEPKASCHAI